MEKVIQERHQVLSRKEMEISDITQKLSQNMERTNHMVTEFEKLKVEHVERSRISEETIGRLKEELSNLKVERSREHDKLQSLEKSLREATSLYEHARSQHSTLTEANRKFASEHNKYKETITKNHQNIEKLTKENTSINSKIAELSEKLQAKVTELVEVQKHDKLARELLHGKEQELNKTLLRAERAETKLVELERSLERLSKELDSDRQTKNAEIFALKNALKKDSDEGRERLNHELLELKSKLMSESSERHEILIRENQELRQRLEKESNELRDRKSHEEDILRGRLELVERLEKETALEQRKS
ncbi:hypothetical protein BC829DRAFT_153215 [Chytridium lagenaria]|nr:hypothetical protein BC829DRAFT_153215 [Chytridium lagenaria]